MELEQDIVIKVLSYNTLIEKSSYTPTVKNDATWRNFYWRSRLEQLILKMVSQSPDVICLQQIRHVSRHDIPNFYDFYNPLNQMGFEGVFARRNIDGQFGQEGLAIFFNKNYLHLVQSQVLYYNDGTGRHALAITLRNESGVIFRVATTHIMYPIQPQKTERQVKILQSWDYLHQKNFPCIITGDFNLCQAATDHYNILKDFCSDNFYDTHEKLQCRKGTFSLNLQASNCPGMIPQIMGTKIDYIFATKDFKAIKAEVIGKLQDLPTNAEPSDHLPISTTFIIPKNKNTFIQDIRNLKQLLHLVQQRNYQRDQKFKQFLDVFWQLPQSLRNPIFSLTYQIALKLGKYENNIQFGRLAFTNNTNHHQIIFDQDGNEQVIYFQPITNELIPKQQIMNVLQMIEQRMIQIPLLISKLQVQQLETFLEIFDQKLKEQICNEIYGWTYKISFSKGLPTHHLDYGRVSFRNIGGWNIPNEIRIQALKKLQLP